MSKIHLNQSINYLLKEKKIGLENLKNPKAVIDYSQTIDAYENLEDYNPRVLVFDDMIADMDCNKN